MWLLLLFIPGLLFMVVGGVLLGGIFTLVLVPLAIVAALSALAYLLIARATGADPALEAKPDGGRLPHSGHSNTSAAPNSPDDLVDARQQQQ